MRIEIIQFMFSTIVMHWGNVLSHDGLISINKCKKKLQNSEALATVFIYLIT